MTDLFSTLRSLMNQPRLAYHERKALFTLAKQAADTTPDIYEHQWLPYMTGFPHHFQYGFEAHHFVQNIEQTLAVLPFARVDLSVHIDNVDTLLNICQHPNFKAVDTLTISNKMYHQETTQDLIEAFCMLDAFEHLRSLGIQTKLTPHTLSLLVNTPSLQNLHTLGLSCCQLDQRHINILCDAPQLQNLRQLKLEGNDIDTHCIDILAHCPHLPHLKCLDLSGTSIQDHDLKRLASTKTLSSLSAFYLRECDLTSQGILHLLDSDTITQLQALDLNETYMTDLLEPLAQSPKSQHLHLLDFSSCQITPHTMEAFFASTTLPHLQYLDLSDAQLTEQTIIHITESSAMPSLQVLNLSFNSLSTTAIKALAQTPHSQNLYVLGLMNTDLNTHSAQVLAQSPHLKHIAYLDYQTFEDNLPHDVEEILLNAPYIQDTTKHHFNADWRMILADIERSIYHRET